MNLAHFPRFSHTIYEHFLVRWYPTLFSNNAPHRPIFCFLSAEKPKGWIQRLPWSQARLAQSVHRIPKAKVQYYTCFYFENLIFEFLSLLLAKSENFYEKNIFFFQRSPLRFWALKKKSNWPVWGFIWRKNVGVPPKQESLIFLGNIFGYLKIQLLLPNVA